MIKSRLKRTQLLSASLLYCALIVPVWADTGSPNFTIAEWTEQFNVANAASVASKQAADEHFAKNEIKEHCVADREFLFYFQRKLMISQKINELVINDNRYDDKSRKALSDQVDSIKNGVKLTQRGVDLICGTDEEKAHASSDMLTDMNAGIQAARASAEAHMTAGNDAANAGDSSKACTEIRASVADFTTTREGIISLLKLIGDGSQLTAEEKSSEHKYAETLAEQIDGLQKGFVDTECKSSK